jgi:hypothetical protein
VDFASSFHPLPGLFRNALSAIGDRGMPAKPMNKKVSQGKLPDSPGYAGGAGRRMAERPAWAIGEKSDAGYPQFLNHCING